MAKYYAPALEKGLDILEFLSVQSVPQSQLEIANGIKRTPNEIYRMLVSLENRGYITKDPVSGKYSLTLRLFQLAHHHSPVETLVKASEIHMENLANCIRQSVHLSVLYHNKLLIVAQAMSQTPVSLSVEIGSLFPLELTNSGRVILSNLDEDKRREILANCELYNKMKPEVRRTFDAEVDRLGGKLVSIKQSQLTEGVTDFSAPIFDRKKEVIAVLAVSTLSSQMRTLVSPKTIEKELLKAVSQIKASLGIE